MTCGSNKPHTKSAEKWTFAVENVNSKLKKIQYSHSQNHFRFMTLSAYGKENKMKRKNRMNWKSLLRFSEGHQPKIFRAIHSFHDEATQIHFGFVCYFHVLLFSFSFLFSVIHAHCTICAPNGSKNGVITTNYDCCCCWYVCVHWSNFTQLKLVAISFHFDSSFFYYLFVLDWCW